MEITTTTQIIYSFTLTKDEAHAVLEEPKILLDALRKRIVLSSAGIAHAPAATAIAQKESAR